MTKTDKYEIVSVNISQKLVEYRLAGLVKHWLIWINFSCWYADNFNNIPFNDLHLKLKTLQRTRHLCIWHDSPSISNHGYLLIMPSYKN